MGALRGRSPFGVLAAYSPVTMSVSLGPRAEPIPGYRLIERLGRGGFGEVWKAEAPGGLLKAIKFVYGDLNATGDGQPAEQELKSLERVKSIRHPYILSLERFEVVDGQLLIVMELADRNLWDRFRDCRAKGLPGVPRDELLQYMTEAAEALDLMNQQYQLQHLDIKPQNLFLVYNHVKIADFGLVKDFEGMRGTITGGVTPVYAAPETFEGWVSRNSDQYSLAIVFQEVLTGQRPFTGSTARQLLLQHLQAEPDLKPLPEADRPIIQRALAKKPDERFDSCTEFVRRLRNAQATTAGRAPEGLAIVPQSAMPTQRAQSFVPTPTVPVSPAAQEVSPGTTRTAEPFPTQLRSTPPLTLIRSQSEALPLPSGSSRYDSMDGTGVLTPALVIGVGGVGGRVLMELRSALGKMFPGQRLPHLRFLAIDTDPATLHELGTPEERRLDPEEIYHAGLNRPSHYLKAESTTAVESWLPTPVLHRLPRHPAAAELRLYGRLAFCDHAAALGRRMKSELEACRGPSALNAANEATQLGIRTDRPRVYVIAGLGGGTGGGMFIDLAYLAKSLLRQMGEVSPQVIGGLLLPPVARQPGRPAAAAANTYASLLELRHFNSQQTVYSSRADRKATAITDADPPFHRVVVLPVTATGQDDRRDVGAAGAWLARELMTYIGRVADRERTRVTTVDPPPDVSAQTVATYFFANPREQLSLCAARMAAVRLLEEWTVRARDHGREAVAQQLDQEWEHRQLAPEELVDSLNRSLTEALGRTPADAVEGFVSTLQNSSGDRIDEPRAGRALEDIVRLVGPPRGYHAELGKKGSIVELLAKIGPDLAQQCEQRIGDLIVHCAEQPGMRIPGAEEAVEQLNKILRKLLTTYESLAKSLESDATQLFRQLYPMVAGFDRHAMHARRRDTNAREFFELLRNYAKKQYQALLARQLREAYRGMLNSLPEYLHEVQFCRERLNEALRECRQRLESQPSEDPCLGPGEYLMPSGSQSPVEAASTAVAELTPDNWLEIDTLAQATLIREFRSFVNFCLDSGPKPIHLVEQLELVGQAYFLKRVSAARPAELVLEHASDVESMTDFLSAAIDHCQPVLASPQSAVETMVTILAVPSDASGAKLRAMIESLHDIPPPILAESREEVVLYRELRQLDLRDLPQMGAAARSAYQAALNDAISPPHSRMDVTWLPLMEQKAE